MINAKFSGITARVSMRGRRQRFPDPPKSAINLSSNKENKMETQTATQSQTQSENAMERFVRKTRALFAQEPDLDKRWNSLRPILAELLADPEVIAASKQWPDCVPGNGQ